MDQQHNLSLRSSGTPVRFDAPPGLMELTRTFPALRLKRFVGLTEEWLLPVAGWEASSLADIETRALEHHTLVHHQGGAPAQRRIGRSMPDIAGVGAVSLQHAQLDCEWHSDGAIRFSHIYIPPAFLRRLAEEVAETDFDGTFPETQFAIHDRELAERVHQYTSLAQQSEEPPSRIEMDARAILIGIALLRSCADLGKKVKSIDAAVSPLQPWQLRRLIEYVDAHLDEDLRLQDLASVVGQSIYHFSRTMKAATGLPPGRWLSERRIQHATRQLEQSDLPIVEIALDCGFGSQQHFTTMFRRVVGTTPAAYRRAVSD